MMLRRGGKPPAGPDAPAPAATPDAAPATGPDAVIDVQVADEQDAVAVDADGLARLAGAVFAAEGVTGSAEVTLTFVDEDTIATLNAEHLDETGPTDVLSFPLDDPDEDLPPGMVALLGDIVICPAVARRYAATNGRSVEHELALLVVHGALHILGHDHAEPDEAAHMAARELELLRAHVDPAFVR
ncbi:MAG: rRNA maturation RNase YbeY [Acidimicrobiales bacterium]